MYKTLRLMRDHNTVNATHLIYLVQLYNNFIGQVDVICAVLIVASGRSKYEI